MYQNQLPRPAAGVIAAIIIIGIWGIFKPSFALGSPFEMPPAAAIKKLRSALIETEAGSLIVELYPEIAPRHVTNFKYLADRGFYRSKKFHIYKEHYIIQGGAPAASDADTHYSIPSEFSELRHALGTVGMARKPNYANAERRSSGTQFHILLSDAPHMDGEYTIFGRVVKGFDVLMKLREGTVIKNVQVFVRKVK
jgi:peptidyl-prolyl cis-trans isomerase B (cyclophilin B)